jgi:hypothetical protein
VQLHFPSTHFAFGVQVFSPDPFTVEGVTTTFKASADVAPFVVALSWMDLPGTPGTSDILIQDLDLKVRLI